MSQDKDAQSIEASRRGDVLGVQGGLWLTRLEMEAVVAEMVAETSAGQLRQAEAERVSERAN